MAASLSSYVGLSRAAASFGAKAEKDIKDFVPKAALGGKQVREKIPAILLTGEEEASSTGPFRPMRQHRRLSITPHTARVVRPAFRRTVCGMGITRSLIRGAWRLWGGELGCLTCDIQYNGIMLGRTTSPRRFSPRARAVVPFHPDDTCS